MPRREKEDHLRSMAIVLAGAVKKIFEKRGVKLSTKPVLEKKPVIEFMQRMRVFGMEKFPSPTYISTINFFLNRKDMEKQSTLGMIALYIEQEFMDKLIKMLQYPYIDEDDEEQIKDACGAICNLVCGQFKADLALMGFSNLEMSHFSSYRNSALMGVPFYSKMMEKYELSFYLKGEKRMVLELSMGPIPRVKKEDKRVPS